jgi:uncharacterized protein YndB with AHSA1/START domain
MNTEAVRMTQTIGAPTAAAYRAFTRSVAVREWMCDGAVVDARPGGRLYVWWNSGYYAAGEFTALEPERRVAFTWQGRGEPGVSQVEVVLAASGEGVEVTLTHGGFGAGDTWRKARDESQDGWTQGMENLKAVLETGQDLRYVLRPMLGIYVDEFNAEIAARLGVPVSAGTRLSGVVAGMGAQAAGLRAGDVIIAIAGRPADNYPSLVSALQPHRAGDRVPVEFYRGRERCTTEMVLSRRPIPDVPATPVELAEVVRRRQAELFAELEGCLTGVTDAEAAYHPAPGEWNVLEVIAHLIAGEIENHIWIGDLLNDDERWSDRFENPTNVAGRVRAMAEVTPGLAEMVAAFKRRLAETAVMLAALPPAFVAHKGTYWRLGQNMLTQLQTPAHVQEHAAQIRAAVAAARRE